MDMKKITERLEEKVDVDVDIDYSSLTGSIQIEAFGRGGAVGTDGDYWDVEDGVDDLLPKLESELDSMRPEQTSRSGRSSSKSHGQNTTGPGGCPSCGGPTSISGELCDGCR